VGTVGTVGTVGVHVEVTKVNSHPTTQCRY
jgi:hypothetical protein